jgi:hypothetical protein
MHFLSFHHHILGSMELTMLRQITRQGQLSSLMADMPELDAILEPKSPITFPVAPVSRASEIALAHAPELSNDEYSLLRQYLSHTGRPYEPIDIIPRPPGTQVLPKHALCPTHITRDGRTYSTRTAHRGNSAIQYRNRFMPEAWTGNIQTIWQLPLDNSMHTFVVIQPHQPLSPADEKLSPYTSFPALMCRIYDAKSKMHPIIVEPADIVTHLTTYERPSGTYGIDCDTLVVCWSPNRGRGK